MWKSEKCLTQRLTLHRMKFWICSMTFYPLSHRHSWQDTTKPITGFDQCGLSRLSCLVTATTNCITSSLTLVALITYGLFDASFLLEIDWSMSSFCLPRWSLFYFYSCSETVVFGVDPNFLFFPLCWTAGTRWSWPPEFGRKYYPSKPYSKNNNDSWDSPLPHKKVFCK